MACIVVFCTTYALILPAITLEKDTVYGIEEHTHSEECYQQVTVTEQPVLSCGYPHAHTEACYALEQGALLCQVPEERAIPIRRAAMFLPRRLSAVWKK